MGVRPTLKVYFGNKNIFFAPVSEPKRIPVFPKWLPHLETNAWISGTSHLTRPGLRVLPKSRALLSPSSPRSSRPPRAPRASQNPALKLHPRHGHHSLPSHQVVTNGSLIPNNTSLSPAMTHSTPLRPEWEASPVVRLPDWAASSEPRSFPADYGLPVSRRPEVNRHHLKPLIKSSLSQYQPHQKYTRCT